MINFRDILYSRFVSFGAMGATEHKPQRAPTTSRRWTIRRKVALLEALRRGALTLEEASRHYALSLEELRAWERDLERYGVHGLRATRVQIYRATSGSLNPNKGRARRPKAVSV
jgi:hypothetical protein